MTPVNTQKPEAETTAGTRLLEGVTVTTNDRHHLEGLFANEPLVKSLGRIVVVDNECDDGSGELAEQAGATVVRRPRAGYGEAINTGARLLDGDHIIVLNPDIRFFDDDVIERLMPHFDDPKVGLVAPALELLDGRLQDSARRVPTPLNLMIRRRANKEAGVVRQAGDVDWVVGAFFIIRRDVWDAIGGFDESFFLYFDDVDLCERIRQAGWTVRFDPTVVIQHAWQGASRRSILASPTRHHIRSAVRFFARNPRYVLGLSSK